MKTNTDPRPSTASSSAIAAAPGSNSRSHLGWLPLTLAAAICAMFVSGCATQKPLPRTYLESDHEMAVTFKHISPKAQMRDSGQGGLIGALVTATSRASKMKEKMAGIQGETVKELITQTLNQRLEKHFVLGETAKDLQMEITIQTWGWFVPTTALGIKTGAYQCEIVGMIEIHDLKQGKKKVAFTPIMVQKPLGNKPEEVAAKEAIIEAAAAFANQTADFLVGQSATVDQKAGN